MKNNRESMITQIAVVIEPYRSKSDQTLSRPQFIIVQLVLSHGRIYFGQASDTVTIYFHNLSVFIRLAWEHDDPRRKFEFHGSNIRYILYDLKLRIFKKALCQIVFPLTTHPFTWHNVTFRDFPLNY